MNYANVRDFMSFFFVGKYVNSNNISARNIAPDINSKPDIYTKTAKLVNMATKSIFSKYNALDKDRLVLSNVIRGETIDQFIADADPVVLLKNAARKKNRTQNTSLTSYAQFSYEYFIKLCFLQARLDTIELFNDDYVKRFYLSLLFGANIVSPELFGTVYRNSYYGIRGFIQYFNTNPQSVNVGFFNTEAEIEKYLANYFAGLSKVTDLISGRTTTPIHATDEYAHITIEHNASQYRNIAMWLSDDCSSFAENQAKTVIQGHSFASASNATDNDNDITISYQYINLSNYYNIDQLTTITEAHTSFINQEGNLDKVANISYKNMSFVNDSPLSNFVRLGNICRLPNNECGFGKFIRIVKMKFENNKVGFILYTNIPDLATTHLYQRGSFDFYFKNIAYSSSANFNNAIEQFKTKLSAIFTTKEIIND